MSCNRLPGSKVNDIYFPSNGCNVVGYYILESSSRSNTRKKQTYISMQLILQMCFLSLTPSGRFTFEVFAPDKDKTHLWP